MLKNIQIIQKKTGKEEQRNKKMERQTTPPNISLKFIHIKNYIKY